MHIFLSLLGISLRCSVCCFSHGWKLERDSHERERRKSEFWIVHPNAAAYVLVDTRDYSSCIDLQNKFSRTHYTQRLGVYYSRWRMFMSSGTTEYVWGGFG